MKMFTLYNLSKDLIRKEAYFEVSSILEDLFQIQYNHDFLEYQVDNITTVFHRFFHDHIKEVDKYSTSYRYLGIRHREDGPAYIRYDRRGNIIYEEYWLNYKRHREDGPTIIEYGDHGNILREEYYLHNERHREDGPAIIEYDINGNIVHRKYYTYM